MGIVELKREANNMATHYGIRESLSENIYELAIKFAKENCEFQIKQCAEDLEQCPEIAHIPDGVIYKAEAKYAVSTTKNVVEEKVKSEK